MKKHFTLLAALLLLTVASWAQVVGGVPEAERNALIALYDATNGPGWTNNTNWKTNADVADWNGVTVESGHVTRLDLSNNQLSGSIPATIGHLTSLTWLDLSTNRLSGAIPSEVGNLSALTALYLNDNRLSGAIPPSLGGLTKLITLYLSWNSLSGSIPSELGSLTLLNTLNLTGNQLTGAVPSTIAQLVKIRTLYLSNNMLTKLCDLSSLTDLKRCITYSNRFDFSILAAAKIAVVAYGYHTYTPQLNPQLTRVVSSGSLMLTMPESMPGTVYRWFNGDSEIPGQTGQSLTIPEGQAGAYYCKATNPAFPELTLCSVAEDVGGTVSHGIAADEYAALRKLYESTNGPGWIRNAGWNTDEPVAGWYGVQVDGVHVSALQLWSNNLTGEIPSEIGNLTKLTGISFTGNNLTGNIPSALGNLTALDYLYLPSNKLSGTIPQSLGNLSKLTTIGISGNELSGTIPSTLGNLKQLQELYLDNNELTGSIPVEVGEMTSLTYTDFQKNRLSGAIPSSLSNLTLLERLYLGDNLLSGSLPSGIGSLSQLTELYLSGNSLSGLCALPVGVSGDLSSNYFDFEDLSATGVDFSSASMYYDSQAPIVPIRTNAVGSATLTVPGHVAGNVYKWYKNGTEVTGQTTQAFTATEDGDYRCEITNSTYSQLVLNTTVEKVSVASGTFTLTADASDKGTITVDGGAYTAPLALAPGAAVKVKATPYAGYLFVGWVGSVNATDAEVTVTMDASKLLVAKFIPIPSRTLFVVTQGSGSVTVDGEAYTAPLSYIEGTKMYLKATPAAGYLFKEWKGAGTSTSAELDVTLDVSKTMVAVFEPISHLLTVTTVGSGSVTVNGQAYASPLSFAEGTMVTLKATPAAGYTFTGWSGALSSIAAEITVTMDSGKQLEAKFEPISHLLTVTTVGSGSVSVNGQAYTSPLSLAENSSAALKAIPATGYTFTGWSGAATSTGVEVSLTMDAPKAVTATFTAVTGVEEEAMGAVKVYPNPFSDALQFENGEAIRRVTILNMVGRVAMVVDGSVSSIKTGELRSGVYLVKIEDAKGSCITRRMVKK